MALGQRRAQAAGFGLAVGLASLLCWRAAQDSLHEALFRWEPEAQKPESPQRGPASLGNWLEDEDRPRPMREPSPDDADAEPESAALRAAESQSAAAGADGGRWPRGAGGAGVGGRPRGAAGADGGRPPMSQRQAAASPPAPPQTCDASCEWRGHNGTCGRHIQWLVDQKYSAMPQACSLAHSEVRGVCPSCSGCSLPSAGCTAPCERSCTLGGLSASCQSHVQRLASREPAGAADACAAASAEVARACPSCSACPVAATGCVLPCDTQCTLWNFTASCRSHIQWLVDHDFSERQDACDAAHQQVLGDCPSCSSCGLSATGCKMFQGASVQMRLLHRIYGISVPSPLQKLPSCATKLQVFIYDISSAFNADLIASIQKRRRRSNCNYEVTQCHEQHWDSPYSVLRSCAGEVPLLLKFLSMPLITDDAQKADLFVVPWFGALNKMVMEQPWGGGDDRAHRRTMEVITQLPHMRDPDKARRHVFLSSIDHDDVDTTLLSRARAGALLLHYGPSAGPDEIVVVPSGSGFGAPLEPLQHPAPNFLFYMAGAINRYRKRMDREVSRLRAIRPDLRIVHSTVEGHRNLGLTPGETQRAMSRSLLCPIAQGDLPFQHRFFDALVSGCLPVVIRNTEPRKCDTWSFVYTAGTWGKWPRPCVHSTYPLASSIRYEDVVVQVPAVMFKEGRFAEYLATLNTAELEQKRRRLEGLRQLFVYDRTGETYDAFSGALREICKAIGAG